MSRLSKAFKKVATPSNVVRALNPSSILGSKVFKMDPLDYTKAQLAVGAGALGAGALMGLGSPSATTAMAGDNELINKATTIATKITTLEQQKANVEKGTEQGDIVKIEEEIEGLKMELNDYIVPKDGPNGKEKSIAYTRKNVKIEYFKYFLEDEARKSTEKQLEDKKYLEHSIVTGKQIGRAHV